MKLSKILKYIPIAFAIIIVVLIITMGFYIGCCIGHLIVFLICKYITDQDSRLIILPVSVLINNFYNI